MTPTDRTRERRVRMLLAWAVVMTAAASICVTAYLAVRGLDEAATAVAATGVAAVTIGTTAWAHARPCEAAAAARTDAPVGTNGDSTA